MTADQFKALAELLRLRSGSPRECARLVLVDGRPIKDAAGEVGLSYRQGAAAVQRARVGLALAQRVALPSA